MIWDEIMDYAKYCRLLHYETFIPVFLCSIGAHIANYHNRADFTKPSFHSKNGQKTNLRLHLFSVGPPGHGKSIYSRLFCEEDYGLLQDSIPVSRQGKITDKGLTGGYDNGVRIYGEAEKFKDGIISIEEFDHIIQASKQDHSLNIVNDLLDLLDSGWFKYRKGDEYPVRYQSYFTLFAGTQPDRLSVSSGLARRLALIDMAPDNELRNLLFEGHYNSMNINPDMKRIRKIRSRLQYLWKNFAIQNLIFHESYQKMAKTIATDHLELEYLDKFAIGYRIMRYYRGGKDLEIHADSYLHNLLKTAVRMKNELTYSAVELSAIKVLDPKKIYTLTDVRKLLASKLHLRYDQTGEIISSLIERNAVIRETKQIPNVKRPVTVIKVSGVW